MDSFSGLLVLFNVSVLWETETAVTLERGMLQL